MYPLTIDQMIDGQIVSRGIRNRQVLDAMSLVDRSVFVPPHLRDQAYADCALPVSQGQTISQPYIVALMTELLDPQPDDRMLEIGTGTGYQTAILAELAGEIWSVEVIPALAVTARELLASLGYLNIHLFCSDGYLGIPEESPFDKIIITAAPEHLPETLMQQLAAGGRMVVPVGVDDQSLLLITKSERGEYKERNVAPVRFVPMIHPKSSTAT